MNNTTFSRLLQQILDDQNINLTDLSNILYNLGLDITYSALYSYYSGVCVPPFSTAKKILGLCNASMEDKTLEGVLNKSKEVSRNENVSKEKIMRIDVKIKPESISKNYIRNPTALRSLIDLRAEELFSDDELNTKYMATGKRKLGAYIAYLIKKDLIENDVLKEDE